MNYAGDHGPVSDRESDGDSPYEIACKCGARETGDCECIPEDDGVTDYEDTGPFSATASDARSARGKYWPTAHQPRGSKGDDWGDCDG